MQPRFQTACLRVSQSPKKSDLPGNEVELNSVHTVSKETLQVNNLLCVFCRRTADNEISCIGRCLADSDY